MEDQIFAKEAKHAWENGICVRCKENAEANCYSQEGRAEYETSGLCEKCYDHIYNDLGWRK